jgi:hypothetical protein
MSCLYGVSYTAKTLIIYNSYWQIKWEIKDLHILVTSVGEVGLIHISGVACAGKGNRFKKLLHITGTFERCYIRPCVGNYR